MSSKKLRRWIDFHDYKTCLKIIKSYYSLKGEEKNVSLISPFFLALFIQRFFFIFLNIFRHKRRPYAKYFQSKSLKSFVKRLLGFYKLEVPEWQQPATHFAPLDFKAEANPAVTIIITVMDYPDDIYNCLRSILEHTQNVKYEILVIGNTTLNKTHGVLKTTPNITYLEQTENASFSKACNQAAAVARGKYICLLNHDTQVTQDWLLNLLIPFQTIPDMGLTGAKIIYAFGLIKEAGSLINRNGETTSYGKYELPDLNPYNYLRETDYCSRTCFLLTKADFLQTGGFDEKYTPGNYQDADLCMTVRYHLHKKVYYQPLSAVIIQEKTIKHAQEAGIKKNHTIFKEKWATELHAFQPTATALETADKFRKYKTVLLIDTGLPAHDKASGYKRIYELIKIFRNLGFNLIFLPHDQQKTAPYYSELINLGVELVYPHPTHKNALSALDDIIHKVDIAWVSRPELNEFYEASIRKQSSITWLYDTVDLHFIREERGLQLQNQLTEEALLRINEVKKREIRFSKEADITIAITDTEKDILNENGAKKVIVIPNVHAPYMGKHKSFSEREGICFIGGYDHEPNIDAVVWLTREIMPLVWKKHPDIPLTLLGSNPRPAVLALQSNNVKVPGYVEDVTNYFTDSRICVAPLRYGAGMKGKVGQSLEFSLPVVTTDIGAEGMDLKHERHVLIANTTADFAAAIIRLYEDEKLWSDLSSNAMEAIEKYSPKGITAQIKTLFT